MGKRIFYRMTGERACGCLTVNRAGSMLRGRVRPRLEIRCPYERPVPWGEIQVPTWCMPAS